MPNLTPALPNENRIRESLKGKKVCILDDEPDPIEILEAYLSGYGLEIDSFTCPSAAMEHIQNEKPDILLLDVMMPEIDGWDLYTRLRTEQEMNALPVLFVTCLTDSEVEAEMQEGSLCATLSKPVDRRQLISKMLDLLD
jgi:DNA-binding response OmpR family regulator